MTWAALGHAAVPLMWDHEQLRLGCVLKLHVTSFQLCAQLAYDTPCFPQTQCWIHHGLSKDAGIIMQTSQAPTLSQRGVGEESPNLQFKLTPAPEENPATDSSTQR